MARINIHGPAGYEGWFDDEHSLGWSDEDVHGIGSLGPGRGESLYHTTGGRWVLETWSRHEGEGSVYRFLTDTEARDWLARNDLLAEAEELLDTEPRPTGRPEIGNLIKIRLGGLLPPLDDYARRHHTSRANAIRHLIRRGLQEEGTSRNESA